MYSSYKEEDPIYDNKRQESMDFVQSEIRNVIEHGTADTPPINEVLEDTTINDFRLYMHQLVNDQDLPYKLPILREYRLDNIDDFAQICDYTNINVDLQFSPGVHSLFFIETSDFAITIIPIKLDEKSINIYIEPLDCSPDLIKDMWKKTLEKKSINDLKREGKFIKLHKGGD